ncbi:MAG: hypothetical protein WBV71_06190, partial [Roseobacter sp.]
MKDVAAIALVVAMISTKAAAMQYECRGHWEDGGSDTVFLQFDMGGWISNLFSGENKGTGAIVSKKYPSLSS